MNLNELKEFVKISHGNQKRKQGTPYYLHPFAVAEILKKLGYGIDYQIAALFHDLLEDTDITYEKILELSNVDIAESVRLVTKEKKYNMPDYIARIEKNKIAKIVKLADRVHNLSEAHFASKDWIDKYIIETKKWYLKLSEDTALEKELVELIDYLEKL